MGALLPAKGGRIEVKNKSPGGSIQYLPTGRQVCLTAGEANIGCWG